MKDQIIDLISKRTKLKKDEVENLIEIPPNSDLGDYAFPCFILSKTLRKPPIEIALELTMEFSKKLPEGLQKIENKGPYINFFMDKKAFVENAINLVDKNYGKSNIGKGKKVIIEFSQPNTGKPMHVGHIRSTILGDSILRAYDYLGYDVVGINYLGDIGLHIGKLIVAYELWLDKDALKKDPIAELLRLYVKFNEEEGRNYEEGMEEEFQNNEWTNKAKEKLKLLELGDEKAHKIWKEINKYSMKGFNRVYDLLKVNFHETTGQSKFSEKGKKIIEEALKKGIAKREKDGAVYVEFKDLPKKYILRSNDTASYMTQDIGAAVDRHKYYKFDKMIYVVDTRQSLHFQQLFATLEKFGYDFTGKLKHLPFGTVNFGNEIMATRKGKVVLLEDVLKKTIERAQLEIKKRKTKGNAELIGVGAMKYAFLKNEPVKDINFSWETSLNFEGDSGPYIQYSYARASSIIKKSKNKSKKINYSDLNEFEIKLSKKILDFPEKIEEASEKLSPNIIANYSFQLAQTFNEFYHSCKVVGDENESRRIKLIESFRTTIKNSLYLLGIEVMEVM